MFGLGTSELILILVIVLIVFGVGKLPPEREDDEREDDVDGH